MAPPTIQYSPFAENPGYFKKPENDSSKLAKNSQRKLFRTPNLKENKDEKIRIGASSIPRLERTGDKHRDTILNSNIAFNKRKSLSLMEIKRIRKSPQFPKNGDHKDMEVSCNLISPVSSISMNSREYFCRNVQYYKDFYYYVSDSEDSEIDHKTAARKVFSSIMLYAWRLKRQEVRRLHEEIAKIKKSAQKTKNSMHALSLLFKTEQRNNDDLNRRLRRCFDDQQKLQDTYNELKTTHSALQIRLTTSEQALDVKLKEVEELNGLLDESKNKLFKSMARERELQMSLSNEQRRALELENEKNEFLNRIAKLEQTLSEKLNIETKLIFKTKEVDRLQRELSTLEHILKDLKVKESQLQEFQYFDTIQRQIIDELSQRIYSLEEIINNTLYARVRRMCYIFGKTSMACGYLLLQVLLPMTPHSTQFQASLPQKALERALEFCYKNKESCK